MDLFPLIAAERRRLADELEELEPQEWELPSRCAGWSVHVVAAHLNSSWSASLPTVLLALARHRSIDRAFDQVARDLAARLDPAACVARLREHAEDHFTPPGFGPEAPLTDVIVHGADMLEPCGRSVAVAPDALSATLSWLGQGNVRAFVPKGRVDGLSFEATDLDLTCGPGPLVVRGPAVALCSVLTGRNEVLDQLTGPGVDQLTARL